MKVCLTVLLLLCFMAGNGGISEGADNVVLVTGFEPFHGRRTNASWEAVRELNDTSLGGAKIVAAELPVVWEKAATKLQQLVQRYHPAAVICFGEGIDKRVRLEMTARNSRCNLPDNLHARPSSSPIYPSAAPSLETALPIREINERLAEAGIATTVSSFAGTFVCNETFYTLLLDPGTDAAQHIPRGLIHLPPSRFLDRARLRKAAQIIIGSVLEKNQVTASSAKPR